MSSFTSKSLLAAVAGAVSVAAHGHVSSVTANGKTYPGFTPFNGINNIPAGTVGWATLASDNGFVLPSDFTTRDIVCHKGSVNAKASVTVAAGSTITLQWDQWPDSHKGPVLDYLAPCGSGGCASADASSLEFFKIDEAGLEKGVWSTDTLMKNGNKWNVTIPAFIKAGEYVLRHELFGLHGAFNPNGAQLYPQCINLIVTGSGTETPKGVPATKFYSPQDPGILFNLYSTPPPTSYPIPGPAVISAGGASSGANNGGNSGSNTGNNGGNNNSGDGANAGNNNNNNGGNGSGNGATPSQPPATKPAPSSQPPVTKPTPSSQPPVTKPATSSQPPVAKPTHSAGPRKCKSARRVKQARREAARREAALRA